MTQKMLWERLKARMPAPHWQRIESGATGRGVPDINGCFQGRDIWIELKTVKQGALVLTWTQVVWHERRVRAGGTTFILAADDAQWWLWHGRDARIVHAAGICAPALSHGSFRDCNWAQLQETLFQ